MEHNPLCQVEMGGRSVADESGGTGSRDRWFHNALAGSMEKRGGSGHC